MSWITENPWPLMLILAGVTTVMLILGDSRGKSIALGFGLITIGLYFVESVIVTPAEQVEASLQSLLKAFVLEDLAAINRHIADDSPLMKEKAKEGLDLVQLSESFHVQDVAVRVAPDGNSAEAELRANGSLTVRQSSTPYHAATRWRTTWVRGADQWRLSEVDRLNPLTGEEIGVLERQ